ncbi:nucleotide-binding protein [Aureitalea sp. L0-47]|uniref:nucleotide-binding protein n=1 Tax=Aureitalea sp. L0-47 TaxID=2816962 RepID=UPI00223747F9|nr:nucleotide-binding protein [Aureitalea sp. L0-47]MCW5519537.1 nucleotide-binding protein [Aureitalea sp. L0-47]
MENKINELINESKDYTFEKCSYESYGELYSKSTPEMQAWAAECEDFILSNYGKDSSPWRIFEKFDSSRLDGNYQSTFESEMNKVISALQACLRIKPVKLSNSSQPRTNLDITKVFIVHGHDNEVKNIVARFIESLNLKAIILHEQASSSKTIIEKIEEYSNVGFGIVLYTPCDIGGKNAKTPDLKPRARQNVVFEHGFLMGKIGRENVCALVKGEIETPNDIAGVVYIQIDKAEAWKFQLAKELKNSGYEFDMNKLI